MPVFLNIVAYATFFGWASSTLSTWMSVKPEPMA
jgi:hypothetical protein